MEKLIGAQNGFCTAIFEGSDQDAIAVIVIDNKDVTVALAGGDREPTGKIHVGLAFWRQNGSEAVVGTFGRGRFSGEHVRVG